MGGMAAARSAGTSAARSAARSMGSRPQLIALALVSAWAVYQLFWNLAGANPGVDEPTYTRAGLAYLHGDFAPNRQHPPTAKYLYGLAQVVSGRDGGSARYVAALATLGGSVVLFLWIRQELGWWAGLLAGGLWALTPKGGTGLHVDLGRYAMLEPIMVFFAIAALAAGWQWSRTGRWWWLVAAGGLLALSVTSKVSTVFLLPALLLLPVLDRQWRRIPAVAALVLGSFAVVCAAVYQPLGARSAISFMIDFQQRQQDKGHLVEVAGTLTAHPPWWADLWFLVQGVGVLATVVLVVGMALALAIRPGRLVAYLGVGLSLMCVFYLGLAGNALATYYYAFMPFVITLAAIGYARAWQHRAMAGRVLVGAGVVGLGIAAAVQSVSVADQHPTGMARVQSTLSDRGITQGTILFEGVSNPAYNTYFRDGPLHRGPAPYVAIVIGRDARYPRRPEVSDLLRNQRSAFDFVDLNGIQLWIPEQPVREVGGVLTVG